MISQQFTESLGLLLITAILTSFLIPFILKRIEDSRSIHHKIIDAQSHFLDQITDSLWRWRQAIMRIAYYGKAREIENYKSAWREYSEQIWDISGDIRINISKSRRLLPPNTHKKLIELQEEIAHTNGLLTRLAANYSQNLKGLDSEKSDKSILDDPLISQIYQDASRLTTKIDDLLYQIAIDLHLSQKS